MKLIRFGVLILCIVILLTVTGCIIKNDLNAQIDIRGEIAQITTDDSSKITAILVEGKIDNDTRFDKANVKIDGKTKIFKRNTNQALSLEVLKQKTNVEIVFSGPVAESYPVQAAAKIIRILEPQQFEVNSEPSVSDYFPFKANVRNVYKGTGNEYADYETYVDYVKDDTIQIRNINPGTVSVFVYKIVGGSLKRIFRQGETYYRHDYTASTNEEEILIKEPIKVGTSWTTSDGGTRIITNIDKTVSTPIGEFQALEITTENVDNIMIDYYVKNIGHVKSIFKSKNDTFTITSELEKSETGCPIKQTVRLFYPEFLKDRVVYIDNEIELLTNQDIVAKLLEGLKQVPQDSGLSPVLSANTQILNILPDDANNAIIVDFSQHLISEMNAGTSFEAMILKSIANTFGTYYQKQRVYILVDGKPYASGHVLMKPEDFLAVDMQDIVKFEQAKH